MKTLLEKLTRNGVATGIGISAIAIFSGIGISPVQAQMLVCESERGGLFATIPNPLNPPESVLCGDKLFSNFDFSEIPPLPSDFVNIQARPAESPTNFSLTYLFNPQITEGMYTYSYDVEIVGSDQVFDLIGLDFTNNPAIGMGRKEVRDSNSGELLLTLESLTSESFEESITSFQTQHISITDVIMIVEGGAADSLRNDFTQSTIVSEPSNVLGLLAIGGLVGLGGLGTRLNKQI